MDADVPGPDQRRKHERRSHLNALRTEQQTPPVVPVGNDATENGEQKDRELTEEVVQAEEERGLRQVENEPALRHFLHPRADRGGERAKPENPEVPVAERCKRPLYRQALILRGSTPSSQLQLPRHPAYRQGTPRPA